MELSELNERVLPDPEKYGWTLIYRYFVPVTSEEQVAPDTIVNLAKCACHKLESRSRHCKSFKYFKCIHFEDIKANYESVVAEKDKEIVSQRKTMEEYDERLCVLISKESNNGVPCNLLKKQNNKIENFSLKPKRKGSAKNVLVKCEKPSCEPTNMDMIRCNLCLQFVCEQCSEIPVAKLKTIMDECKTLYFICKSCKENFPEGSDTNNETEKQRIQGKKADGRDLVETIEDTLN